MADEQQNVAGNSELPKSLSEEPESKKENQEAEKENANADESKVKEESKEEKDEGKENEKPDASSEEITENPNSNQGEEPAAPLPDIPILKEEEEDTPELASPQAQALKGEAGSSSVGKENEVLNSSSEQQPEPFIEGGVNAEGGEEEERGELRYDLLDYLFSFLETEEELNQVLCGYFCKLIGVFLKKHSAKLLAYMYAT